MSAVSDASLVSSLSALSVGDLTALPPVRLIRMFDDGLSKGLVVHGLKLLFRMVSDDGTTSTIIPSSPYNINEFNRNSLSIDNHIKIAN